MVPLPQRTSGQPHFMPGTHEQPAPLLLQSPEQPSPSVMLPSSQTSPSGTLSTPSPHPAAPTHAPQRAAGMQAVPGAVQTQPCSSWQLAPQPSLAVVLPSSQFSPGSTR